MTLTRFEILIRMDNQLIIFKPDPHTTTEYEDKGSALGLQNSTVKSFSITLYWDLSYNAKVPSDKTGFTEFKVLRQNLRGGYDVDCTFKAKFLFTDRFFFKIMVSIFQRGISYLLEFSRNTQSWQCCHLCIVGSEG